MVQTRSQDLISFIHVKHHNWNLPLKCGDCKIILLNPLFKPLGWFWLVIRISTPTRFESLYVLIAVVVILDKRQIKQLFLKYVKLTQKRYIIIFVLVNNNYKFITEFRYIIQQKPYHEGYGYWWIEVEVLHVFDWLFINVKCLIRL